MSYKKKSPEELEKVIRSVLTDNKREIPFRFFGPNSAAAFDKAMRDYMKKENRKYYGEQTPLTES